MISAKRHERLVAELDTALKACASSFEKLNVTERTHQQARDEHHLNIKNLKVARNNLDKALVGNKMWGGVFRDGESS